MANLKEIRSRIASVKSTQQITSAMKMVSAAKLRKSQTAILKLRPYSQKMAQIMAKAGTALSDDMPFARKSEDKQHVLLVVLTSNKGLCSVFNSSVIKLAAKQTEFYLSQGADVSVMSYGKKGSAALKKFQNITYVGENDDIWEKLTFDNVNNEAQNIMDGFLQKKYDRVEIIYNQFKNAATQLPTAEKFLPVSNDDFTYNTSAQNQYNKDYIFAPSKEEIISSVIPQSLKTQMYKCFLDSFTSEHGARMTSMNKATDNAQSLLKELTLTYNKQRQSDITNQIIEVSNGANAV
ncbi:MAG: ATP synthase F1 subunit gamma [Bacteroidales bacterium]|nr:ATP synthase F1 subunit gamma [Bacteroidales bacterium]